MENEMEMKILEFHPTREKTGSRGNGKTADSWKPGAGLAPSPAPLSEPPY